MISSKQRATLRGIAQNLDATAIIGKDGITDEVLDMLDKQLFAREIVKVSVLDGCELSAKECLKCCAEKLKATEVCSIGRKFVLYRLSNKKGLKHIEF